MEINVVIDERKHYSDPSLALNSLKFIESLSHSKRIFKDYILSSEVYYLDELN